MADNLSAELSSLKIDRNAPPPSRGWPKVLIWLAVLGVLGGGAVMVMPYLEAQVFKTEVEVTEVVLVSPAQAAIELTASGYVQADVASRVAPKVPGRVSQVHVRQGERVAAGQLLIQLDPSDDEASIAAAKSRVAAAWSTAKSAEARAAVSKAQLAEVQQLAQRERQLAQSGVTGYAAADDLEARVASLQQALSAAEAEVDAARAEATALNAQVNVLKTGLSNLKLTSPIAGTIINKPPQIGEYTGPQPPGVTVDMGGIRVADFSTLLVETDIPEGRLNLIRKGGPAEIVLDAYPAKRFRGRVKEITPEVDRAKATVMVKVAFVDETDGVLPDMSARVSFLAEELDADAVKAPPKVVVPGSAVVERAGEKVVFVVDRGVARQVRVELGEPFGAGFELAQGPTPGTKLVNDPPEALADGQTIKKAER